VFGTAVEIPGLTFEPIRESTDLADDKIVDPAKLEPVHIAVVALK